MYKLYKRMLAIATLLAAPSVHAGLLGTEMSLSTLAQGTSSSTPFTTSFERTVVVSAPAVEYPDVASLFNPGTQVPPGFARSLVNVAIDVNDTFLTIDFDNAGTGRFASAFQNTYVLKFDSATAVDFVEASIAPTTNLGLLLSDITFVGSELRVNVESLAFNANSFVRIDLQVVGGPPPIPEPATFLTMAAGIGIVVAARAFTNGARRRP